MPTSLAELESDNTAGLYIVDRARFPWGDYGHLLVHGMTGHLGRQGVEGGPIQLERTGPFVPPITFPGIGDIIVTDDMKQNMERSWTIFVGQLWVKQLAYAGWKLGCDSGELEWTDTGRFAFISCGITWR